MRRKRENRGRFFLPSYTSVLLRTPTLSLYLPLSLLPPAQESISTGSISWHEYSLPAESLVGERRRLRHRRRQWRRGEGWGRRRERKMRGEMSTVEVEDNWRSLFYGRGRKRGGFTQLASNPGWTSQRTAQSQNLI